VIRNVVLSRPAQKDLARVPAHVAQKLMLWAEAVRNDGLEEVRRIPGYHDEPLHGRRQGQRSLRLSRSYRAIYVVRISGEAELVSVEEVTKHAY
jgi:proteic killer suppression protein